MVYESVKDRRLAAPTARRDGMNKELMYRIATRMSDKLPPFDMKWSKEVQEVWWKAYTMLWQVLASEHKPKHVQPYEEPLEPSGD